MEFLSTNLTSCIEQNGILPKEISYSILHDVALGLCYLHSQTPPIIHRDLSSNSVLLTPNMTAKISDLGVASILNLTPLQVSMTQTPGTPAYMPPEVMVAKPKYNTSVDEFSYGIMMIHMFSGRWPEPQVGQIRAEPGGRMIPVSEAERREVFLQAIGNDNPLMDLIRKCIDNYPQTRAHASEIVGRLADMVLQFPVPFANRLDEALRQNEALSKEIRDLREEIKQTEVLDKENRDLKKENRDLKQEKRALREEIERKNREIQELRAKNKLLKIENKITGLNLQDFSPQVSSIWKRCAMLPIGLCSGNTTVISGKVYYGGGVADLAAAQYIVYSYDPSQDKWTTIPLLPVKWFGLGQVNGKLVAVGGRKKSDEKETNGVYTYDERFQKWKQTIPPMPTARYFLGVLSLQSALVVAGGCTSPWYTAAVEIFKPATSQWYRTDPLPTACCQISLVAVGNTCCVLGGCNGPHHLNQALHSSVDNLLGNAVPASLTTSRRGSSHTRSVWKILPNTPTYGPAAAVLAGNLLAIGGKETSNLGGKFKKEICMYSPSTNSWIFINDLPASLSDTAAAVLSSTEILVIGGEEGGHRLNTVYKGNLHLKR